MKKFNVYDESINLYAEILKSPSFKKNVDFLSRTLKNYKRQKKRVVIAGNGGSSSIASHVSVDMTKVVGIRSINFNEHNLITCLTNDFGQDNWLKKAFELYTDKSDLVILISSSGKSKNILNAAKFCKIRGNEVITLTGFNKNNPLNKIASHSIWIDSKAYNIIENVHQIILLMSCDMVLGSIYYKSN